jgi:hypothetical protein
MMLMNVTGGIAPGQMLLYASARRTGKSTLNQYYQYYGSTGLTILYYPKLFHDMKPESKYKFSRAKWYDAKLPKDGQGAFNWCVKNFGPEPKNPDAWSRWYFNVERTFRFRDAKDYEWFVLRWS